MAFKTYGEIQTFVQDKLDLRDEDFITRDEMLSYCEEAIRYCESEIHKLNIEDMYFVAQASIPLVVGQSDYNLPSLMYGNKILRIMYSKDAFLYDIKRLTRQYRFEEGELARRYPTGSPPYYGYMLVNLDPRLGTRMRVFPTPTESSIVYTVANTGTCATTLGSPIVTMTDTTGLQLEYFVSGTGVVDGTRIQSVDSPTQITMTENAVATGAAVSLTFTEPRILVWYIRNASVPTSTTDLIDFPEFWHFIAQFMVVNCVKKEVGNPRLQIEVETLLEIKKQMLETLSNMVPDQDDKVEQDLSSYMDQDRMGIY
jgi:hypothetical protein